MDIKSQLVQILLNTTINDTKIVKENQRELENSETNSAYPIYLLEIIHENPNANNSLDVIAALALGRMVKRAYKYDCKVFNNLGEEKMMSERIYVKES
jgi:hypothetical protein